MIVITLINTYKRAVFIYRRDFVTARFLRVYLNNYQLYILTRLLFVDKEIDSIDNK